MDPTAVRDLVDCPACAASRGERCRRSKPSKRHGWVRIANHQERISAAMRTRYTLDANTGLLADRDGNVLGRVVSITIDDQPPRPTTERSMGYRDSCTSGGAQADPDGEEGEKVVPLTPEQRPTATQLERERVQRIWDYWLEISGKRQKFDSKRERMIRNALLTIREVHSVNDEECEKLVKRALLGLSRSPHHQGENEQRKPYMEIRYALRGLGDESDDERIEKAITWAAQYAPEAQIDPAKVARLLDYMRYTKSLEHHPERERAMDAYKQLKAAGFEVESLDGPPWVRINRG